ncbi:FAD-binding oxidoreductase [Bordetella sp. BOR01]|uniref:NAD(P)/FAD-dependent oxidoreductase n=1 Tax=Bordetella sp. BOR01 TaxID=2854779 RepID=UPI001C47FD70|nr:FAD-dependent oxidoreductase [Bordetella sp. BOR01]MBV7483556.1 FAD-binding oxidoreductase [Bordetella sp. BOR01]
MQQAQQDQVAIIGAGIVGLCTAYALRQAGRAVTLYDANPPASQCSAGNAGALSSRSVAPLAMPGVLRGAFSMLLDAASPLHIPAGYWLRAAPWLARFVASARPRRVREIAMALDYLLAGAVDSHAQVAAELGCPELVRRTGQLHLYPDVRTRSQDRSTWELKQAHGLRLDTLDRHAITDLEPAVGPAYAAGVFLPDEGWMADPLRYGRALASRLVEMQAVFVPAHIAAMQPTPQGWTLSDGNRDWQAKQIVVCAGAWSGALLAAQGYRVPLESQRGYHLHQPDPNIAPSRVVVLADRKVFITPMETGLRMAGTVEFGGLQQAPNMRRAMLLARHAQAGLPQLRIDAPQVWLGHRPCLPDSLPVLGPVPGREGLWCAFGHGHLGLTASVNTGRLIARAMAGDLAAGALAPYSVTRFR